MLIHVECEPDSRGEDVPSRIVFDHRVVVVRDIIDRWYGEDYRYFKIRGDDGIYILLHKEVEGRWDLVMFERKAESTATARN